MDDILASIRRIIADDHLGTAASSKPLPASEPNENGDHLSSSSGEPYTVPENLAEGAELPDGNRSTTAAVPEEIAHPPTAAVASPAETGGPVDEPAPPLPMTEAAAPAQPALRRIEPAFAAPPPQKTVEPLRHQRSVAAEAAGVDSLLSQAATASVGDAFQALSHTVLSNNSRTLEDLVKDMLRPMLQGWLDDNLPPLVERLVRAEIERVARGRS